ncbi:MAG: hypothetical protein DMF56_12305 [Acidobacteria bacterium]|nr:MAG: hypothetical protein DMF56_12305 [Acidobacteriota bacterium]
MMLPAAPAAAQPLPQDVITVATRTGAPNTVVDVPVYIRDTSGTPLGIDQPPGSRIQSYSIKVNYTNASMVSSVTFTRAGITQSLTPTFESSPSGPGTITLLDTFAEATNLIPFTSNAPLPGNQVAHLQFTLNGTATPGSTITLTLDPTLTQLTDQAGSPGTRETTTAGNLLLVAGAINIVSANGPTLSMWALIALALALGFIATRMRL